MWGQEGGDPRQDLHRRFWDTPIYSLPGKPEARVPLSRFPAPGPSQGGWRPPESGAIRAVHRGGGQTFRPPIPAPSIPGFPRLLGGGEGCSPRGVRISPGEAPHLLLGTQQGQQTRPADKEDLGLGRDVLRVREVQQAPVRTAESRQGPPPSRPGHWPGARTLGWHLPAPRVSRPPFPSHRPPPPTGCGNRCGPRPAAGQGGRAGRRRGMGCVLLPGRSEPRGPFRSASGRTFHGADARGAPEPHPGERPPRGTRGPEPRGRPIRVQEAVLNASPPASQSLPRPAPTSAQARRPAPPPGRGARPGTSATRTFLKPRREVLRTWFQFIFSLNDHPPCCPPSLSSWPFNVCLVHVGLVGCAMAEEESGRSGIGPGAVTRLGSSCLPATDGVLRSEVTARDMHTWGTPVSRAWACGGLGLDPNLGARCRVPRGLGHLATCLASPEIAGGGPSNWIPLASSKQMGKKQPNSMPTLRGQVSRERKGCGNL